MASALMIEAEGLTKRFGSTVALDGLDLEVPAGAILGVLGPNGAGKTTAVRILTTLSLPDSGSARVAGFDVVNDAPGVQRSIGVTAQDATVDEILSGRQNLVMIGRLSGLRRAEAKARASELLERFDLADAADRVLKGYSGGMRRRLELAVGLVHRPKILFLDEPTLGLDPQGRAGFWGYVQKLRKETGMTVFVTTHYLDEADTMCDRIAIIDHGKIVAEGTPNQLKDRLGGDVVTVRTAPGAQDMTEALRALAGVTSVQRTDDSYRIKCSSGETLVPLAVETCYTAGAAVSGVTVKRPSLDEVFLEFTGREYREEDGPTATDRAVMMQRVRGAMGGRR